MRTSEPVAALLSSLLAAAAPLCVLVVAVALAGCARSAARPPEPRDAAAAPRPSAPHNAGEAGAAASRESSGRRSAASQAPPSLDPAEEISPAELASIPEPVPVGERARTVGQSPDGNTGDLGSPSGSPDANPSAGDESPSSGLPGAPPADSGASARDEGPTPAVPASGAEQAGHVWRVQVFAAQDLGLADRKAKEAEARLGVKAHIEYETPLYKVRLGDYPSEADAQALRERAIEAGYTGAFRVRCEPDTTYYDN